MLGGCDEQLGRAVEVSADPPNVKEGGSKGGSQVVQLFFHQPMRESILIKGRRMMLTASSSDIFPHLDCIRHAWHRRLPGSSHRKHRVAASSATVAHGVHPARAPRRQLSSRTAYRQYVRRASHMYILAANTEAPPIQQDARDSGEGDPICGRGGAFWRKRFAGGSDIRDAVAKTL